MTRSAQSSKLLRFRLSVLLQFLARSVAPLPPLPPPPCDFTGVARGDSPLSLFLIWRLASGGIIEVVTMLAHQNEVFIYSLSMSTSNLVLVKSHWKYFCQASWLSLDLCLSYVYQGKRLLIGFSDATILIYSATLSDFLTHFLSYKQL